VLRYGTFFFDERDERREMRDKRNFQKMVQRGECPIYVFNESFFCFVMASRMMNSPIGNADKLLKQG